MIYVLLFLHWKIRILKYLWKLLRLIALSVLDSRVTLLLLWKLIFRIHMPKRCVEYAHNVKGFVWICRETSIKYFSVGVNLNVHRWNSEHFYRYMRGFFIDNMHGSNTLWLCSFRYSMCRGLNALMLTLVFWSVVGWPWLHARYLPKLLCHSPPQLDMREKI